MFLEINQVDIGYSKTLISSVSAKLDLGQICLVIGNNGVGKTTLIKSILHQIPILNGEIKINNRNISTTSVNEIAEMVAIVFSKANLPNNYTVTDLISFGKFQQYPFYFELNDGDKKEVQNIIQLLGLEEYQNTVLQKLSDGNLQKAFIGRALAQNAPFIILDEPTAHLDEENKIKILKILRNLAKDHHKLILFTSHDWRLAKEFADRIWYIDQQQLQDGIAEDVLMQNPQLSNPQLFNFHPNFVSPQISAADFEKELLYSTLQKNFDTDLSNWQIEKNIDFWLVKKDNFQEKTSKFEDIIKIIANHL